VISLLNLKNYLGKISVLLVIWITFSMAQVISLLNLKNYLGKISVLLGILPLWDLWMFLQTPRFIATMHLTVLRTY